jgi:RNA polymerase sigma-70 factor (ECF subfamily)
VAENNRIYLDEDTKLMIRVSEGDREAYNRLYKKHFFTVVCFARNFNSQIQSSEDVAQEVFRIIWRKREGYRPTAVFKTYLLGCAKIDSIAHEIWFLRSSTNSSAFSSQPASEIDMSEAIANVQKAKLQLSDKQFQAVELFHDMHMPISKAAKVAKCSEKAFECRLARAHKRLRQIMISMEAEKF